MMRRCNACQALFITSEHPVRSTSHLEYVDDSEYTNEEFEKFVSGVEYPSTGTCENIADHHAGDMNVFGADLVTLPPSPHGKEMCLLNV